MAEKRSWVQVFESESKTDFNELPDLTQKQKAEYALRIESKV